MVPRKNCCHRSQMSTRNEIGKSKHVRSDSAAWLSAERESREACAVGRFVSGRCNHWRSMPSRPSGSYSGLANITGKRLMLFEMPIIVCPSTLRWVTRFIFFQCCISWYFNMYCIVTVVRFVIILIKFYVCMYVCMVENERIKFTTETGPSTGPITWWWWWWW